MKCLVITVKDHKKSEESADRCIKSAKRFHVYPEKMYGADPSNVDSMMEYFEIPHDNFNNNSYSRIQNVKSCFVSHFMCWLWSVNYGESVFIMEHDAYMVAGIPTGLMFDDNICVSLGKPSYGKYKQPQVFGLNPLTSKQYFPGAHAYIVGCNAAKKLVDYARVNPNPADIYLNTRDFPWLQEYYPWPVEARDTFTTVQKREGCIAKHNYSEQYEII